MSDGNAVQTTCEECLRLSPHYDTPPPVKLVNEDIGRHSLAVDLKIIKLNDIFFFNVIILVDTFLILIFKIFKR